MITVRYLVKDIETSIQFYTDSLGFKLEQQFGPAMAIVIKDGLSIWLAGPQASASQKMPDGRQPQPGGWNRFVLQVEDLEGLSAQLRTKGVHFLNEVVKGPSGAQILFEDPSENVIELFQAN